MKIDTLKTLLILLTVIELSYLAVIFYDDNLWVKLDYDFKANIIIGILHLIVVGLFIKKIWNENESLKKKKTDSTIMILVLGLIGMWIWLPKSEIK